MTIKLERDQLRALGLAGEVLDDLGATRCLIGALSIQATSGVQIRPTFDIDIAILVSSWEHYDEIREAMADKGFTPTNVYHRFRLGTAFVDLIPFSAAVLTRGELVWPDGAIMETTGFETAFESAKYACRTCTSVCKRVRAVTTTFPFLTACDPPGRAMGRSTPLAVTRSPASSR